MSVTRLALQAAMIAATLGSSAKADSILTLGIFSSGPVPSSVLAQAGPTLNLAPAEPAAPTPTPTVLAAYQAPTPVQAAPAPGFAANYDAYINFGTGSFLNADSLTTGNPQAWYADPKVAGLFGGTPNAQQVAAFDATVLQRVQQTFQLGGVPVKLTDNPGDSAAHMLSVVSNAVNPSMTGAIGMTNIGGNGFHFIDNSAPFAKNIDQLEWIVAHNVAHELMLAFGVPEVHDQSGRTIDSTVGQMAMFLNPASTFSTDAVHDLLSRNFQDNGGSYLANEAQLVGPAPVPEPATLLAWAFGALALVAARRTRSRRASA